MQQQQQQQQQLMQMNQSIVGGYASPAPVTTDLIQQYLDENKQLILAILDNQNSGKTDECDRNKAKLQHNLMYLAAIADSQPPQAASLAQYPAGFALQSSGARYMQPQQAQMMSHAQSMMASSRSPMLYPQSILTPYQQQAAAAAAAHGSLAPGGFNILHGEGSMGAGNSMLSSGMFDYSRGGGSALKQDSGTLLSVGGGGGSGGHAADDMYAKGNEEGGS